MRTQVFAVLVLAALAVAQMPEYCGRQPFNTAGRPVRGLPKGPADATLIQAQAVFRHGDRTLASPAMCWPDDTAEWWCDNGLLEFSSFSRDGDSQDVPFMFRKLPINGQEYLPGNCLIGQLTAQGYQQHIQNGQDFAEAYVGDGKLLPADFDADLVYIRSDDEPRTMQSVEAVFTGMYPNAADGNDDGMFLIDLHYMDEQTDNLVPNYNLCPTLLEYFEGYANTTEYDTLLNGEILPLMVNFSKIWDVPVEAVSVPQLFDCYYTHVCHNMSLPEEVPQEMWDGVTESQITYYQQIFSYPSQQDMGRVSMGMFVGQLFANMQGAVNGTDQPVFYAYATHDLSIMPLLASFGLLQRWTPYAGVIVFELYQLDSTSSSGDDYAVRLLVYGEETVIPGCGTNVMCPWSMFASLAKDLIPDSTLCAPQ